MSEARCFRVLSDADKKMMYWLYTEYRLSYRLLRERFGVGDVIIRKVLREQQIDRAKADTVNN